MVYQKNWWIHSGHGFFGSFDAPWSEWSWITECADHPKGTHPGVIITDFRIVNRNIINLKTTEFNIQASSWWYKSYNFKYQNLIMDIVISCQCVNQIQATVCGNIAWIGELDLIMQRDSANDKKSTTKRSKTNVVSKWTSCMTSSLSTQEDLWDLRHSDLSAGKHWTCWTNQNSEWLWH